MSKSVQRDLSVFILTFNEELHVERVIKSAFRVANEVFIVDSFSTDRTLEIAQQNGAQVFQNKFINHAAQVNWAIENLPIKTNWVMRLDADEFLLDGLVDEINNKIHALDNNVNGVILKRRVYFKGKWIRHGSYYPTFLLRLWRTGKAYCESKWMDEHMVLIEGESTQFEYDFVDYNLNNITWWTQKHNSYSSKEAIELLNLKYDFMESSKQSELRDQKQAQRKRKLKGGFYAKLPLLVRAWLYFLYRSIFRLGFLDGFYGMVWHTLQGLWYRTLVDIKIHEVETYMKENSAPAVHSIKEVLGIDLSKTSKE